MSSQIIQDKHLGEQYIRVEHPSGLTMLLYPMPGFSTTYAMFSTQVRLGRHLLPGEGGGRADSGAGGHRPLPGAQDV